MSLESLDWAWKTKCPPLPKLLLIELGNSAGMTPRVMVNFAELVEWSGAPEAEVIAALSHLRHMGLIDVADPEPSEGADLIVILAWKPPEDWFQSNRAPPLKPRVRMKIWAESDRRCAYCATDLTDENFTIDHVLPRSRGGTHDRENLVVACAPCNLSKRNKLVDEWSGRGA